MHCAALGVIGPSPAPPEGRLAAECFRSRSSLCHEACNMCWSVLVFVPHWCSSLCSRCYLADVRSTTPGAAGVLCPGVGGHEGPLGKSVAPVIIIGPLTEDH
ncbi:hypothetical protein E2C01_020969 [Portunus trituberculatus]|uniref:Uncharacterized protein n=1 Tax=Portunus trituberculatus TaxID=210409 RepID=A0A5B7E362_PORTR|nr:hypothetical protein [Portunus trituberculatus]